MWKVAGIVDPCLRRLPLVLVAGKSACFIPLERFLQGVGEGVGSRAALVLLSWSSTLECLQRGHTLAETGREVV